MEENNINPLWKQLRTLRKRDGITQRELAAESGCTRQELSLMENGHFRGGFQKVRRAFHSLGYQLQPQPLDSKPVAPDNASIRILAIDDDREVLRSYCNTFQPAQAAGSLSGLIGPSGGQPQRYAIDTVTSGKAAFEKVQQSIADHAPYSLILLDMRMPGGWDGLQTAQALREIAPELRIILLSAYRDYTIERMRESMGENFIFQPKPYRPDELLQLTSYIVRECQQAGQL